MQSKPHFTIIFKTSTGFRANITRKTKISIDMKQCSFGIQSGISRPPKTDGEEVDFSKLPKEFQEEINNYYNLIFKTKSCQKKKRV